jgi:hypothetical protein
MDPDDPRFDAGPIASGDRRDAHLEPAADGQGVRAHFLVRPDEPPPPDEQTGRTDHGAPAEKGPPVEDLRLAPDDNSVWDARPAEDGGPSGH